MNSKEAIQVSQSRVQEILSAKTSELLLENAQLTAVVEALQNRIGAQQQEIDLLQGKLRSATPVQTASPQDSGGVPE